MSSPYFLIFLISLFFFQSAVTSLEDYVRYHETAKVETSLIETSTKHITAHVHFNAHGRPFHLHLSTNQHLFTSDFHLNIHQSNGEVVSRRIDTRHIVIGHVIGEKGSLAHGKVKGGHFEGVIRVNKEIYHVEPIDRYYTSTTQSRDDDSNVLVYKDSDINFTLPLSCDGLTTKLQRIQESGSYYQSQKASKRRLIKRERDSNTLNTCTIHVWSDYKFYSNIGNSDEATTLEAMALHITESNTMYRDTVFMNGGQQLTDYGVAITAANIITADTPSANPLYGTFTVDELLQTFATFDFNSVCLGHLFTYTDFSGTIGLAYVADPNGGRAGGICEERTQTFGGELNLNTGLTSLLTFGRRLPQGVSIITTAHEIGHNYGSPHDSEDTCAPGGTQGNYIMYATATDGTLPNNRRFSSCSRDIMGQVIVNNGNCFVERPFSQVCGNGIVEGTEECDCGSNDTCKSNDPCCKIGECLLEDSAHCSPQKSACCTVNCTLSDAGIVCSKGDECLSEPVCNGFNETCPQPIRDNSSLCNDRNNICRDGICSGSVCDLYNARNCFCTQETQLCDVCCQFTPEGPCESTKDRQNVNNATIQSGFPCKDFTGYCDDRGECIFVDTNIPLDDLKNLIPSFSSIADWFKNNWYWVLGGLVITIIVIILLQVTYRRKKKKSSNNDTNQERTEEASEHLRLLEAERRRRQEEATRL